MSGQRGMDELWGLGAQVGALLKERGETVAVAEGSAGGLVSAALLAVPGASAYYLGGTVVYTVAAHKAFLLGAVEVPAGMRGASEAFARYLAEAVSVRVGATWGVGEAGAAGPPNPYGDPAGHCWVAVHGPPAGQGPAARHLLTGIDERRPNMVAFAVGALDLLRERLAVAPAT